MKNKLAFFMVIGFFSAKSMDLVPHRQNNEETQALINTELNKSLFTTAIINSDKKTVEKYLKNSHFSLSSSDINSATTLANQVYEARIEKNLECFTWSKGKKLLTAGGFGALTVLTLITTGDYSPYLQLPSLLIPLGGTAYYGAAAFVNDRTKQYEAGEIWTMIFNKKIENTED